MTTFKPEVGTINVIILDQFTGPSPYELAALAATGKPLKFNELKRRVELGQYASRYGVQARIVSVPTDYYPQLCETVYNEGPNGETLVWRYNWDSSG